MLSLSMLNEKFPMKPYGGGDAPPIQAQNQDDPNPPLLSRRTSVAPLARFRLKEIDARVTCPSSSFKFTWSISVTGIWFAASL